MKTTKGILVVSFGTTHVDALGRTIDIIERKIRDTFPEYAVYRAFTSQVVLDRLREKERLCFDNVKEALERMKREEIETVIVQPTHIINGIEYDKMLDSLLGYGGQFQRIRIGNPLLSSVEDYKKSIHVLMSEIALEKEDALVLMGHGTDHHANSAYPTLEYTFHTLGFQQVVVGTSGGFPNLNNVISKLKLLDVRRVILMPFLLVAGVHVKRDMAGDEDSWKTQLEEAGYEVQVVYRSLGEMDGIQNIFLEHIEEVR